MEILGIGPMELFFIVLLAIIILGPKDMVKAGRTVGRFMRDVLKSDYYRAIVSSSREIRDLPTRLMREANLEDDLKEVDRLMRSTAGEISANTIHPPRTSVKTSEGLSEPEPELPPDDPLTPAGPSELPSSATASSPESPKVGEESPQTSTKD